MIVYRHTCVLLRSILTACRVPTCASRASRTPAGDEGAVGRAERSDGDGNVRQVSAGRHGVNNGRQHPAAPPSPTHAFPPPAVRSRLPCEPYPVSAWGGSPRGIGCALVKAV